MSGEADLKINVTADARTVSDEMSSVADSVSGAEGAAEGLGSSLDENVTGGLDGASEAADGTDAALGGMAAKAVTSLPGVGDAMGPMTRGLQGVIKGALTGKTSLAAMGATAGLMLAVGLALKGITDELAKEAAIKKFRKEEVEAFTKSIESGGNAVSDLVDKLTKAGKIDVITPITGKTDIAGTLAKAGISVEQFAQVVAGGKPGLDQFRQVLETTSLSAHDQGVVFLGAKDAQDQYAKAQANAAQWQKVFGDGADEAKQKVSDEKLVVEQAKQASENLKDQLEATSDAYKAQADEISKTLDKTKALSNANHAAADANFAVQDATDTYLDSLDALDAKVTAANGNQRQINAAYREVTSNASAVAQAQVDLAAKQAVANGTTQTAAEKQDVWNNAMVNAAATAQGAAKTAIIDYINQANGIPTNVATKITAAIQAGDIETANKLLADASKDRAVAVDIDVDQASLDAANRKIDDAARARTVQLDAQGGIIKNHGAFAGGTPDAPGGLAFVGDDPTKPGRSGELVELPKHSRVNTRAETAAMLRDARAGGGGRTFVDASTTNHYWPPGVSPDTLVRAQRRTDRRGLSS